MSEPIEVILDPKHNLLRLYCGQCGDPKDLTFEVDKETGRINIMIGDSLDISTEEFPEMCLTPVELIVQKGNMQTKEAISKYMAKWGGDGHTIIDPQSLIDMGFTFDFVKSNCSTHESTGGKGNIFTDKGLVKELEGVYSLNFIESIARDVKADTSIADTKTGRGFRAQELAKAITEVVK